MPAKSDPLAAWRKHVQKFRNENPGLDLKTALTRAKETYNKSDNKSGPPKSTKATKAAKVAKAAKVVKSTKIARCECGGVCGTC